MAGDTVITLVSYLINVFYCCAFCFLNVSHTVHVIIIEHDDRIVHFDQSDRRGRGVAMKSKYSKVNRSQPFAHKGSRSLYFVVTVYDFIIIINHSD